MREERALRDLAFAEGEDSPLPEAVRESFDGLDYWQPRPELRFVGPLHRHDEPRRFEIPTTAGRVRPCERFGWVEFEIDETPCTLQVYRLLDSGGGDEELFLPFMDGTTGERTYPAGRYVDLEGSAGIYVLDFNRAFNPLCAYGNPEEYACPVTPPENRLPVRVEAGERGYATLEGSEP